MSQWVNICKIDDILPATGVCALLGQQQVAVFRPYQDDRVFAISNIDPFFTACAWKMPATPSPASTPG